MSKVNDVLRSIRDYLLQDVDQFMDEANPYHNVRGQFDDDRDATSYSIGGEQAGFKSGKRVSTTPCGRRDRSKVCRVSDKPLGKAAPSYKNSPTGQREKESKATYNRVQGARKRGAFPSRNAASRNAAGANMGR